MASNGTLIDIEDLTKVFYTDEVETHALSGIHLTIARGEYVAMSGPSGCGKSTLLSILGLLDTPTGGKYLLNGNPVENLSFADRSRIRNQEIGFIFQSFNLIGDLTVEENVELPLTYRAGMPSAERKKRVKDALERVNMAHRMKHYPAQLSGGQQQRVAVARALAGSPSILLADEPTSALDLVTQAEIIGLLRQLNRRNGTTLLYISHDLVSVLQLCDRLAVLDCGAIAECLQVAQIEQARHPATLSLLHSLPVPVRILLNHFSPYSNCSEEVQLPELGRPSSFLKKLAGEFEGADPPQRPDFGAFLPPNEREVASS